MSIKESSGKMHLKFSFRMLLYSVVFLAIYIVGFISGTKTLSEHPVHKPTVISHFTGWAQIYSLFSIAVIDIIWSWLNLPKLMTLIEQIQNIDRLIVSKLSTTMNYERQLRILCIQVIGLSIVPFCLSMVNCIILNERNLTLNACFWFICLTPILVITLKEFQFYNFMLLLKSKCKLINNELSALDSRIVRTRREVVIKMDTTEKECLTQQSVVGGSDDLGKKLKDISWIAAEINIATKTALDVFAVHLFLITSTALGVITVQIYNLYAFLIDYLHMDVFSIFATVTWISLQFGVILLNVAVCSMVAYEMSNTGPLLHNIQCLSDNRQVFQTAHMFSLQILHRNIHFTAAGFFNLDYKLITSIVGAVTTYLVIIIQFHISNTQNHIFGGEDPKVNLTESI